MEAFVILMSIGFSFFFVAGAAVYLGFAPKSQRYSIIQRRRLLNALTDKYKADVEKAKDQDELDELEEAFRCSYKEIESHK